MSHILVFFLILQISQNAHGENKIAHGQIIDNNVRYLKVWLPFINDVLHSLTALKYVESV